MYRKYILYALPVLALATAGVGIASAHGLGGGFRGMGFASSLTPDQIAQNQQDRFQKEADFLGIGIDKVKDAWASGKNIGELAEENGISQAELQQKMKDARTTEIKTNLQTLVDKGVITQSQADARLNAMQNMTQNKMGRHMGFRF